MGSRSHIEGENWPPASHGRPAKARKHWPRTVRRGDARFCTHREARKGKGSRLAGRRRSPRDAWRGGAQARPPPPRGTPYIPLTREIAAFGPLPPGRCFPCFQNNSLDRGIPVSRVPAAIQPLYSRYSAATPACAPAVPLTVSSLAPERGVHAATEKNRGIIYILGVVLPSDEEYGV